MFNLFKIIDWRYVSMGFVDAIVFGGARLSGSS
jgi:hypothetical protein